VTRDPYTVLGIPKDATLAQARAAYRRLAELFHPDRLQGLRRDVQEEGAQRLREATEAMQAIRTRLGRPIVAPGHERAKRHDPPRPQPRSMDHQPAAPVPSSASTARDDTWKPSDWATSAEGRLYDVDLRAVDGAGFHVRWTGRHAAAVLAALRHGHRVDGTIRQVEWGCYQVILDGAATRRLLDSVLPEGPWKESPVEVLELNADVADVMARRLPARQDAVPGTAVPLGTLIELLDDTRWYSVLADVY
jgi:hypothetical protein